MAEKQRLHDGHRDRLRKRFVDEGLDHFNDHQILELLLFYSIARRDTNGIAHRLMNHCGSLTDVMTAGETDLLDSGVSPNTATLMKLISSVCMRYYDEEMKKDHLTALTSSELIGACILPHFDHAGIEQYVILLLDQSGERLFCDRVDVDMTEGDFRKILELCIRFKARSLVMACRHEDNTLMPITKDVEVIRGLKDMLVTIRVALLDYYLISDKSICAMSEMEEFEELFF